MLYWIELLGWNEMNSSRVPPDLSRSEGTEIKFGHVTKKVFGWVVGKPRHGQG